MENNISLNDVANVVNIIDYAFSKGIFVGPDVVSVGEIRNRFANIVEEAKQKQETATSEPVTTANQQPASKKPALKSKIKE